MTKSDRARLTKIAATIEGEAQTWREGFACFDGHVWTWNREYDWAHARVIRLESARDYILALVRRDARRAGK